MRAEMTGSFLDAEHRREILRDLGDTQVIEVHYRKALERILEATYMSDNEAAMMASSIALTTLPSSVALDVIERVENGKKR